MNSSREMLSGGSKGRSGTHEGAWKGMFAVFSICFLLLLKNVRYILTDELMSEWILKDGTLYANHCRSEHRAEDQSD